MLNILCSFHSKLPCPLFLLSLYHTCRTTVEKSVPQQFTVDSVPAKVECEKGCTYDLMKDKCLCAPGTVEDCPGEQGLARPGFGV
jgi:hypothetical protein